mmetsp:Transcript_68803/g.165142  ORF Transcript_68803/g.165142 Transcript_68803/m.165142 type:complete len:96 (-) Transcript_68803:444-731(-)
MATSVGQGKWTWTCPGQLLKFVAELPPMCACPEEKLNFVGQEPQRLNGHLMLVGAAVSTQLPAIGRLWHWFLARCPPTSSKVPPPGLSLAMPPMG